MKKFRNLMGAFMLLLVASVTLFACTNDNDISKAKFLTLNNEQYTFNNYDLKLTRNENTYTIDGDADYFDDTIKTAWGMPSNYMVALKLQANQDVVKAEVVITITGTSTTNANGDNMDGDDFIYLLLDVAPSKTYTIFVKWNADDAGTTYTLNMASTIELKTNS